MRWLVLATKLLGEFYYSIQGYPKDYITYCFEDNNIEDFKGPLVFRLLQAKAEFGEISSYDVTATFERSLLSMSDLVCSYNGDGTVSVETDISYENCNPVHAQLVLSEYLFSAGDNRIEDSIVVDLDLKSTKKDISFEASGLESGRTYRASVRVFDESGKILASNKLFDT